MIRASLTDMAASQDPYEGLSHAGRTLASAAGHLVARCVADKGLPEIGRLLEPPASPGTRGHPMSLDSLELGPATPEQARRYGVLGSRTALAPAPAPVVNTTAGVVREALDACDREHPELAESGRVAGDIAQFFTAERARMLSFVEPVVEGLLGSQTACLRATYPGISQAAVVSGDVEGVLAGLHLREGELHPARTTRSSVEDVEVILTERAALYTPSADEITFASSWAACSKTTRFHAAAIAEARSYAAERFAVVSGRVRELLARADAAYGRLGL